MFIVCLAQDFPHADSHSLVSRVEDALATVFDAMAFEDLLVHPLANAAKVQLLELRHGLVLLDQLDLVRWFIVVDNGLDVKQRGVRRIRI